MIFCPSIISSALTSKHLDFICFFLPGKDEASSLEVTWPDGRIFTRGIAEGEMNSVLEIVYPLDEDSVTKPTAIEVMHLFHSGVIMTQPWKEILRVFFLLFFFSMVNAVLLFQKYN